MIQNNLRTVQLVGFASQLDCIVCVCMHVSMTSNIMTLSNITGSVVAGVVDWYRPHPRADGLSVSLYEKKAESGDHYGDPIADAFAVVARPNSCILALADGVNWGVRPRLAARAAVRASIQHMHDKLFSSSMPYGSTQDIFHHILLAFDDAHKSIINSGGTTTTLTVAMVVELMPHPRITSRWGLCVVSVGDSPCFIYQQDLDKVFEVTAAAHMGKGRDPRDSGGCLGANLGENPDLGNLVCCFTPVLDNDIVFLTSDGVSDNLDPVILKKAISVPSVPVSHSALPLVKPEDRQEYMVLQLMKLFKNRSKRLSLDYISVQDVVDSLISYCVEATDRKRSFLEQVWTTTSDPQLSPNSKREMERKLSKQSKELPGKLDHTTIVGYQVGELRACSVTSALNYEHDVQHTKIRNPDTPGRWPTNNGSLHRTSSVDEQAIFAAKYLNKIGNDH